MKSGKEIDIATKKMQQLLLTSAAKETTTKTMSDSELGPIGKPASSANRSKKCAKTSPTEVLKTPSSWTT